MKRLFLVLVFLLFAFPVIAQDETPIVVYISWDGSPGWVVDRLLEADKLPNVQRLIDAGVHVQRTVGQWPSLTAAGHAAVFTGAYGNVNGVTANGVPAAPFENFALGASGASGFSAANLLVEPIWVTAARQGLTSSLVSVTQSSPFEMYTTPDFISSQGAQAFGNFADELDLIDPYAAIRGTPGSFQAGGEEGIELTEGAGAGWTNLPDGAAFRSFTLGGGEGAENPTILNGLLVAEDGAAFDHLALSADGDYSTATILRVTPFTNDASQMSAPVWMTLCNANGTCGSGYTHFRLTELAEDGSAFTLWHTYLSDIAAHIEDTTRVEEMLALGGAFTGNGAFLPSPFGTEAPELPNVYGEIAFTVNEWFFNNLVSEIEANENDLYFSYSPYPDEWHHAYYSFMDENSPVYTEEAAAKAWAYDEAMYGNLDMHLGRVIDALEGTGRPWNVVLFTDHGFTSAWRYVYVNRILAEAGLLTVDADGNVVPGETKAFFGSENAGGIHINAVGQQAEGIVTEADYPLVVQEVTDALLAATDPETGEPMITDVYISVEFGDEGVGGAHGADLYIQPAYGYYWRAERDQGPTGAAAPAFVSGVHGPRPNGNPEMLGFAVLGGANFVDGVVVEEAASIDLTPTLAQAVGIEPAAHWTGMVHADWVE